MDNAATSFPKPEAVYRAVEEAMRKAGGNPGRSAHSMALAADRLIFEARETLSTLLGIADSSNLIFTSSATESLNLAIKGILKPGDHVVTSSIEHDAVEKPLRSLKISGVEITEISPHAEGLIRPEQVINALKTNTTLVVITHASNVIGTIQPVADIGTELKRRGIPFLVDASQTAGSFPIDVESFCIDLLAAPGHKGLLGPQGTGILYIAPHLSLSPFKLGGTGGGEGSEDFPTKTPERYEAGTPNTPGISGLGAGARFILDEGIDSIRKKEYTLIKKLYDGLREIDGLTLYGPKNPGKRASLLSFNIKDKDPATVAYRLDDGYGVQVRDGLHCSPKAHRALDTYPVGAVRLSPGWFNTEEEIDRAIEAITEIAKVS